eukprot:1491520-Prymnesium_polylepis.1
MASPLTPTDSTSACPCSATTRGCRWRCLLARTWARCACAREDCCYERLSPFDIWLSPTAGQPRASGAGQQCGGTMSPPATAGP